MKLTKCNQGHFYDADKFAMCPHCAPAANVNPAGDIPTAPLQQPGITVPLNPANGGQNGINIPNNGGGQLTQDVNNTPAKNDDNNNLIDDVQKTVGIFQAKGKKSGTKEPVAGWLVCTDGPHYGEDFRIKMGRNFVGRSNSMDIVLSKDSHVSREKHAIVVYEPKGNMFIVQAGESKELSYLNDRVILSPQELNPYDVITLGSSKLLFVPFCSENFKWNLDKDEKED